MIHREFVLKHLAPWFVSGASSLYVVARARRLSRARASRAPLSDFLMNQSDMILALCGSPVVWYLTRPNRLLRSRNGTGTRGGPPTGQFVSPLHQLRQVFTALMIGTGLLVRKASQGKTAELMTLALRLHQIVREGVGVLATIDDLRLGDLLEADTTAYAAYVANTNNGQQAVRR